MRITDKISSRQPKYTLPAIVHIPLITTGYFVFDIFNTEVTKTQDRNLQTTEFLNPNLPGAQIKNGDGIGGKYENMAKSYGHIADYPTADNIGRDNEEEKEAYESKYTEEDLAELVHQVEEKDDAAEVADAKTREVEALEALNKVFAEVGLRGQAAVAPVAQDATQAGLSKEQTEVKGQITEDSKVVKVLDKEDKAQKVVKKMKVTSDYLNILTQSEHEPEPIKVIIDGDVKATDGSRVRLRLLDDVEIGEIMVKKGSYLYATMSGFGSQRVKGSTSSILVDDELIKVSPSLYDTDRLEGLYASGSQFRETTKDVASGAMQSSMNIDQSGVNNSFSQWGMQAVTNVYQRTSNAISKAIKKNKVKLKYETFVYLVNGKEERKQTLPDNGIVENGGSQSINIKKSTNMNCFQKTNVCALPSLSVLPVKAQTTYTEMEQLTVNDQVTTVIIASESIRFIDTSTDKVVGNQPISNTVRLKPKDNVHADGEVLAIVIIVTERYRTQYALLYTTRMQEVVTDKEIKCSERNAYNSPAVSLSTTDMAKYARQIWPSSARYRNMATKMHHMVMRLNSIYSVGKYFFTDFSVENKTNTRFNIDEMRIKLPDKKQSKATNTQIVELTPSPVLDDAKTFKYGYRNVIVVKKMTLPNDKVLTIGLSEKQIGRCTISLNIDHEDVLSADSSNHILLEEE